jgi:flagellar biosynthesis/type III secretory pathway chaperone
MSGPAQVTDLLKTMSRLIEIMEREIALLRHINPSEMQELQRDKIALAAAYDAQTKALRENEEALRSLAPEMQADLLRTTETFQQTLLQNERALKAAKLTTDRVLTSIAREVDKQRREDSGYSANGLVAAGGAERPVSLAVDQRT